MIAIQPIKLAEALASAGRIQEATVYFNALLESQQGSGVINLQLARLAARQGNESQAIEDYQRAIYGNWEGDGYVRRREVRFELINYLIAHQLLDQARSELLVASGNAPRTTSASSWRLPAPWSRRRIPATPCTSTRRFSTVILRCERPWTEPAAPLSNWAGTWRQNAILPAPWKAPAVDRGDSQSAVAVAESRDQLSEATRDAALYPSSRLKPA